MNREILITNTESVRDGNELRVGCTAKIMPGRGLDGSKADEIWIWSREAWEENATNAVGRRGAFVTYIARSDIDDAVAKLRAVWGGLPVKMNLPERKIR